MIRMSRFKTIGIACLVLTSALVGVQVPRSEASATPFGAILKSHHFNMCSGVCGNRTNVRNLVQFFMASDGPHTVSLNEACLADVLAIQAQMGWPGPGYYEATETSACPFVSGWGNSFGNAAFVVGNNVVPSGGPFFEQKPGATEIRGYACAKGDTYIGPLVSCAAHLLNNDVPRAQTQGSEYSFWVASDPRTNYPLRILSGDMNLTSGQLPPVFPGYYGSIVTGYTFTAPSPSSKIDHIFILNPNLTYQFPGSARYCDFSSTNYSDHCYIFGKYQ